MKTDDAQNAFLGQTPEAGAGAQGETGAASANVQSISGDGTATCSSSGTPDIPTASALFLSAFFDELIRCGVRDVVVSPGSRSTPLAMVAFASDLRLHIDVDERGAAFYALGMAKASGRPACAICTSGTAVGNYYPAVLEAESSRVPLILLTGDRPPRLQNLGAPQTCDQVKAFGDHVRHFQQMPLPGATEPEIAFARQMALTAYAHAAGSRQAAFCGEAGPVHFNFPFEEPLKPNLAAPGLFTCGRRALAGDKEAEESSGAKEASEAREAREALPPYIAAAGRLGKDQVAHIESLIRAHRTIVLCGEASFSTAQEAHDLLAWAHRFDLPLIADPLSKVRSFDDELVIDNYDNIFGRRGCPEFDLIVRFGRYPVSKHCSGAAASCAAQLVVDAYETRDFNAATDTFIRCSPAEFVASFALDNMEGSTCAHGDGEDARQRAPRQRACAREWITRNAEEARRIAAVSTIDSGFEGAFIHRILDLAPPGSCVFSASSMSIRMVDTFYLKSAKNLTVLCNRGLNGIDGTLSSAAGASHFFDQTTLIIGDLAFIHDMNALSLQRELLAKAGEPQKAVGGVRPAAEQVGGGKPVKEQGNPSIIVLLINNSGGGIFELLPQKSEDAYFERLFITPQSVDFAAIAAGFAVPYRFAATVEDMAKAYGEFQGDPGIHILEVNVGIEGLKERYGTFLP